MEKQVLTQEEIQSLKNIQNNQSLLIEQLGVIEYRVLLLEKEKEKQKQKAINPNIENNPEGEVQSLIKKSNDVREIIEFWDNNGFGFSNVNAKQQLLSWLDDSPFLQPKDVVLKALTIACSNNKRKLNYVVGILRNWENESLLNLEEIEVYQDNKKSQSQNSQSPPSFPAGRDIPRDFVLDITAGEEE